MRQESARQLSHGRTDKWDTAGMLIPAGSGEMRGPLGLAAIFDNHRPVEVEIGTGKGTFLLERASDRPEINFLGIEYIRSYCMYAADRFRRAGLRNVRILHADAGKVFGTLLAPGSVNRVHIYFPDPWPKRKHHRRRLFHVAFARAVYDALAPGGQLLIVTDHREYYEHILATLSQIAGFAKAALNHSVGVSRRLVGTNFENKYIAQGRPFYSLAVVKYLP